MPAKTVTVRAILPILAAVRGLGVDAAALLREHQIDGATLFDSEARISHQTTTALWTRAIEMTGDPRLGLRALEFVDGRLLGSRPDASEFLVLQLFAASANVGDALQRLTRSYGVLDEGVRLELVRDDERWRLVYVPSPEEPPPPAFIVFQLGMWSRMLASCASKPLSSVSVELRGAEPQAPDEYRRVLCADVSFGASEDAISISASDVTIAMQGANAEAIESLERRAEAVLEQASPARAFAESVRAMVATRLAGGNPSAEAIASTLGMSVRTLSRRLEASGTSHRAIMDEVRADLARRWLCAEGARVEDVSRRLGFSDASAFHRAFKRWFAQAPSDFVRDERSRHAKS